MFFRFILVFFYGFVIYFEVLEEVIDDSCCMFVSVRGFYYVSDFFGIRFVICGKYLESRERDL